MATVIPHLVIKYRKPILKVCLGFFIFIVLSILLIFNRKEASVGSGLATANQNLNEAVLKWQKEVETMAKKHGGSEYVPYILALMQIESGGTGGDPMQASESLGLSPNTISNPKKSIERGVEFFIDNVKLAESKGADFLTAIQAYNYGPGFIDYVATNGGHYSFDLAEKFSAKQANGKTTSYINEISTSLGYNYRYDYGNMFYVPKLLAYVQNDGASVIQENENNTGIIQEVIPKAYKNNIQFPRYDGHNYNTSGSYPFGQCTWYVYNRLAQLGKKVDDFMGNGGEWGTKGKALGYQVTSTPKVGTAISFPPGTFGSDPVYGHVAFVEVVNTDGTLLISECNVVDPGSGTISYREVPPAIAAIASYIE